MAVFAISDLHLPTALTSLWTFLETDGLIICKK